MTIILIGYMGSGKSTIGQELSKILKFDYLDLDVYIQNRQGSSISKLFETKGEIYFRKIESEYLKEVLLLENTVISLGGGTPCYGTNMDAIKFSPETKSIYLKASIPCLVDRLFDKRSKRPLIAHLTNKNELTEFIGKHLFERSNFYNQSDFTVSVDQKTVNKINEDIVMKLF